MMRHRLGSQAAVLPLEEPLADAPPEPMSSGLPLQPLTQPM